MHKGRGMQKQSGDLITYVVPPTKGRGMQKQSGDLITYVVPPTRGEGDV